MTKQKVETRYCLIASVVTRAIMDDRRAKVVKHQVIPHDATVAELEQKANDAEKQSVKEPERATELLELAKLYREWIAQLRSGRWTS